MAYEKDWFVSLGMYGKSIGREVEFTTLEYVKFVDSEESESVTSIKFGWPVGLTDSVTRKSSKRR